MKNRIIDTSVSEYKIGNTVYYVKLVFNPAAQERLEDIIQRLIVRDCQNSSVKTSTITDSRI